MKLKLPSWFVVKSCSYESRRSSVVSLRRCLLFSLNQDSMFVNWAVVERWPVFIAGLPPNETVCTLGVPSANVEFTRTVPLGSVRNGSL